jgi:hypothetical protein
MQVGPGSCPDAEKEDAEGGVLVEVFEAVLENAAQSAGKAQTRRYEALRETFGNWKEG